MRWRGATTRGTGWIQVAAFQGAASKFRPRFGWFYIAFIGHPFWSVAEGVPLTSPDNADYRVPPHHTRSARQRPTRAIKSATFGTTNVNTGRMRVDAVRTERESALESLAPGPPAGVLITSSRGGAGTGAAQHRRPWPPGQAGAPLAKRADTSAVRSLSGFMSVSCR